MFINRRWYWLPSVALVGMLTTAALSQQKVRLKDSVAVGDVATSEDTSSMNAILNATLEGQRISSQAINNREREQYREEVLAVDAKGPTVLRRTYSIHRKVEGNVQTVSSLQGKTVTLKRTGGKTVVTVAKGTIKPEDRKELLDDLDNYSFNVYPNHPVGPGDEWEVPAQQAMHLFSGSQKPDKISVKGRLEEFVQHAGHPCARVRLFVEMSSTTPEPKLTFTVKLEGDVYHATDLNRTLSFDFTGPMQAEGTVQNGEQTIELAGAGTGRFAATRKYVKVAGKPVSP